MLKVENLSLWYGERRILKDVSFSLMPGQMMGVIGPNGAGKTTLIRALSGVMPVKHGKVEVMGRDLGSLSPSQRACLMAVVPQAVNLPPAFTSLEMVMLGRTPHLNWLGQTSAKDEEIARQAMERTETLELAGRRVGELSGGEQQRLMLARALAQSAPILFLDEPTAHLDLKHQIHLLDQVRSLVRSEGLSALITLHDLNLAARYTDRVMLLVDGMVRACGRPDEVLTSGSLSEVYQVPLEVVRMGESRLPVVLPGGRPG